MATLGMNVKWRALRLRLFKEKHDDAFFEDEPRCVKLSLSLSFSLTHTHTHARTHTFASERAGAATAATRPICVKRQTQKKTKTF